MTGARQESARTLAAVFGLCEEEALAFLDVSVAVTLDGSSTAEQLGGHLLRVLRRTAGRSEECATPSVEVLFGTASPRTRARVIRVVQNGDVVEVGQAARGSGLGQISEPGLIIIACYAAAAAVRVALGSSFHLAFTDPVRLNVGDLAVPSGAVSLGRMYLAGAGAVGHAFLYGLAGMQVAGELHVVDPKVVSEGNLNRCMWLEPEDVGSPKAVALAKRAASSFDSLKLTPRVGDLGRLPERTDGPWLEKLVVAVDSRRVRRRLQLELPRDVFDASTTGIEEIVLHFNTRLEPVCLGCVYHEDQAENAHEIHVANVLGVSVDEVREHFITGTAVAKIRARHPQLRNEDVEGRAYDSLFKALCAEGEIGVEEGRTVLAPLAFVSLLSGVQLAVEVVRRNVSYRAARPYSTWRLSPWATPVPELRDLISRRPNCRCCGRPEIRETVASIWNP
jgi:hypothetical protein